MDGSKVPKMTSRFTLAEAKRENATIMKAIHDDGARFSRRVRPLELDRRTSTYRTAPPRLRLSFFAIDGYEQSIRAIKGLKDTLLGVNGKF